MPSKFNSHLVRWSLMLAKSFVAAYLILVEEMHLWGIYQYLPTNFQRTKVPPMLPRGLFQIAQRSSFPGWPFLVAGAGWKGFFCSFNLRFYIDVLVMFSGRRVRSFVGSSCYHRVGVMVATDLLLWKISVQVCAWPLAQWSHTICLVQCTACLERNFSFP